ncbi:MULTISPECIES: hypothetical protein [Deferrisoma]
MVRSAVVAVLAVLSPLFAWAASPLANALSARAVGMGGALRALAAPVEAASVNPAAIGIRRGFFGGAAYLTRRQGAFDALRLTVLDNATSPFGGAIQYLRLQGEEEREDLSLGIAGGRAGQWWGGTIRYVHGRGRGETEWDDVFTGDVGVLFARPQGVRIGIAVENVVDTSLDFLEPRAGAGLAWTGVRGWNFEVDVVRGFDRDVSRGLDLHLGAEATRPGSPWTFWLGQMWRGDTGKDYASAGVGWSGHGIEAGYAVQKARQRAGEWLHVLSVSGSF